MNKANFDALMQSQLKKERLKVLMHACCGPCSTAVIERVKNDCDLTMFWYNPNVQPDQEHDLRKENFIRVCEHFSVEYLDGGYNEAEFIEIAKGFEKEREGGARCDKCFYLRLLKTALVAKQNGFDCFCTTLTISPHKNATLINEIGLKIEREIGIKWLYSDFKKQGGFLRSTMLSKELGLYRQDYCGCSYGRQRED